MLLIYPLLSINKVYSLVVQEEINNYISHTSNLENNSILINVSNTKKPFNNVKGSHGGSSPKNGSIFCTFCNMACHIVDLWYKKLAILAF